jgi:hypothetical protein
MRIWHHDNNDSFMSERGRASGAASQTEVPQTSPVRAGESANLPKAKARRDLRYGAGFPAYETYMSSGGFLTSTYSQYRVRITSLTEGGVTRRVHLKQNWWDPLDRTRAQPYLWKRAGKDLFNIGEIVWAKDEYEEALHERFGDNALAAMLFSRPVVTVMFWTPLVLRLKKFQPKVFDEQAARLKAMREAEQSDQ